MKFKARLRRAWKVTLEEWKLESNMKPETNEDTEDKSSAPMKDKALALAKAGDLLGALAAANTIEDAEERAAALEAIATAEKEPEKVPPGKLCEAKAGEREHRRGNWVFFTSNRIFCAAK
jgi:formate dehydrogenase maturation protein FdhE